MSRYLIDLTTSRGYIGKPAVGIVRTEREVARHYWDHYRDQSQFIFYDLAENLVRALTHDDVSLILREADSKDADHPEQTRVPVKGKSTFRPMLRFADGDIIISCGLLWDHNFLPTIYEAKKTTSLTLIQVVYDVIPLIMPEYSVPGMEQRFSKYILDVAWTADAVGCISEATQNDFRRVLSGLSTPIPESFVFRLGSDLRGDAGRAVTNRLHEFADKPFIVYVSTIEPRKNHQLLFNLWRELAAEMGDQLPTLLFVGRPAWNVSDLMTYIDRSPQLGDRLRILSDLSDNELAWLYDHCAFTVYPSHYEGWGLPVDESLARGRVCVASDTSSIPEIGRDCLELVAPLDFAAWRDVLRRLITDPSEVKRREAHILANFRQHTWAESARQFHASMTRLLPNPPPPTVVPTTGRRQAPSGSVQGARS